MRRARSALAAAPLLAAPEVQPDRLASPVRFFRPCQDCKKCRFDVREQTRPVVETDEGYWHDGCFTCKVCRENVRGEYYFADDMLLCPEHYEMRRGGFCKICYGQLDAQVRGTK